MITASELREFIATMQEAGVTGRAKLGDIEITIPPVAVAKDPDAKPEVPRTQKQKYDDLLFACTEGIPEEMLE